MKRLALALVPLALASGCGGSAHTSSTSTTSNPPPTTTSTTTTPATSTGTTTARSAATTTAGGATNARVPATFRILAGDEVAPATVSAPANLPVQLTVISTDDRLHRVLLRGPHLTAMNVPAGVRRSVLLAGMRAGRYPLIVDGSTRGALVIGAQPGP